MSRCPQGTPKWVRPLHKGKDHQKRGRRGHHWQKLFKEIKDDTGKIIRRIKLGRVCKKCGKKVIVPELR